MREDFFNRKTLAELKDHDVDNLETIWKNSPVYTMGTKADVGTFVEFCLLKTFEFIGRPQPPPIAREIMREVVSGSGQIKMAGEITIERRLVEGKEDQWRSGIYFYKDNEIVTFIGEPRKILERRTMQGGRIIAKDGDPQYVVRTNARL